MLANERTRRYARLMAICYIESPVGRLALDKGPAEDVTARPATATRLWLGALPDGTAARPKLEGSLRQETYVRVYLPVTPRK